ncbi:MAG TPA: hypothetical protein DIT19_02440, partial [Desulfonauticus sp.]|nr:hypothetical protein [Desulfonauticus sp.]
EDLLEKYKENTEKELKEIKQKIKEADLSQAKKLLHKLKGTSFNLRLNDLGEMAANLYKKIESLDPEEIDKKLLELEEKFKKLFQKAKD